MPEEETQTMCDACGFDNPPGGLKVYQRQAQPRAPMHLCKVCGGSYIGNAYEYPSQYENAQLYRSLGYCTNAILKAIAEKE